MQAIKKLTSQELTAALAFGAAGIENILTDADECAAQVRAVKNLAAIASRISFSKSVVATGLLLKNGIQVATATVDLTGVLTLTSDVTALPDTDDDCFAFYVEDQGVTYQMAAIYYPALTFDCEDAYVLADVNLLFDLVTKE